MGNQQHILVAPLDWGLGHATRCIPIIHELLRQQCKVSIAGSGNSLILLRKEFPSLSFFTLPSYNIRYASRLSFTLQMMLNVPGIMQAITAEHRQIQQIVREQKIDGIISDNRYGCWSASVKTVFISHQLSIQMPKGLGWMKGWVNRWQQKYIRKFSECWVPDDPQHSLAGDLSPSTSPAKRIGILSRFEGFAPDNNYANQVLVLLSGPEPQRSILQELCIQQLASSGKSGAIIQGLPEEYRKQIRDGLTIYTHLATNELAKVIQTSEIIVCRSGYSSLMDLLTLRKGKLILVPTPGQTEQEYLANRLHQMGRVVMQPQRALNLMDAFREVEIRNGFVSWATTSNLLPQTIREWLSR